MERNSSVNLDIKFNTGLTLNPVGRVVRSDFNVESSIVSNVNVRSLHEIGGRKRLAMASGYLEYFVSEMKNEYTGQTTNIATPMIILSEFVSRANTLNYVLTSIINATAFTNRSTLGALIIEKDAGPLNVLFNYGGEPGKFGEKLSFKDPKAKRELINDIINKHIVSTPIFAVEVEIYGANYSHMSPFAALANSESLVPATKDIIDGASLLVGAPIESKNVLAEQPAILPMGEYIDANGDTRDLREIDLAFICKHSNDIKLIYEWIYSTATPPACIEATGKDPYTLRLEIYNKLANMLGITPVITGKVARIPLNGAFVDEITRKAMAARYYPVPVNSDIGYNEINNLQALSGIYANATMGATGLGMPTFGNSFNSPIPGVNVSYYRR